jgi:hypothetical protein
MENDGKHFKNSNKRRINKHFTADKKLDKMNKRNRRSNTPFDMQNNIKNRYESIWEGPNGSSSRYRH